LRSFLSNCLYVSAPEASSYGTARGGQTTAEKCSSVKSFVFHSSPRCCRIFSRQYRRAAFHLQCKRSQAGRCFYWKKQGGRHIFRPTRISKSRNLPPKDEPDPDL
jgi:hypothetical protein